MGDNWSDYGDFSIPERLVMDSCWGPLTGLIRAYNRRQEICALQWRLFYQISNVYAWDWLHNDLSPGSLPSSFAYPLELDRDDVLVSFYAAVLKMVPFFLNHTVPYRKDGYPVAMGYHGSTPPARALPVKQWTVADWKAHLTDVLAYEEPTIDYFYSHSAKAYRWIQEGLKQLKWTGTWGWGRHLRMEIPYGSQYGWADFKQSWASSPLVLTANYAVESMEGWSEAPLEKYGPTTISVWGRPNFRQLYYPFPAGYFLRSAVSYSYPSVTSTYPGNVRLGQAWNEVSEHGIVDATGGSPGQLSYSVYSEEMIRGMIANIERNFFKAGAGNLYFSESSFHGPSYWFTVLNWDFSR